MRELKFRIYFEDEEPFMSEPVSLKDLLHEEWIEFENEDVSLPLKDFRFFYSKGKNYKIMQYTGLKDINGKEIYEGDIVAEKGHYVKSDKILYQKIQWKDTYSCWLRGEYQRLTPKNIKAYQIEVVGNIHQNSDLLKEE